MLTLLVIALTFMYGFLQGKTSSASIVSAMVTSRAIHPRFALAVAMLGIVIGPFLIGTAVAGTIRDEIVLSDRVDVDVVVAALLGAIVWSGLTLRLKVPISTTHALFGGLMGAAWVGIGHQAIQSHGLFKSMMGLLLSPLFGLICGYIVVSICYRFCAFASPHINIWFQRGQILLSILLACSFGGSQCNLLIGILTLGLFADGAFQSHHVASWELIFSIGAIGSGALLGGWSLVNVLGNKFYRIRPIHGFGAQIASTGVILGTALAGWPVSSSQVTVSAIVGAGSAEGVQKVRWQVIQQIVIGWLLTLPLSALASALIYEVIRGLA
jgi:PiT family inorganic phosphate transporter